MNGSRKHRFFATLMALVWGMTLLVFSAQEGVQSGALSGAMARPLFEFFNVLPVFQLFFDYDRFHFILRKSAHFFVYFVFGVLTVNAVSSYVKITIYRMMGLSFFGLVFALWDETIQRWTLGRVFSMTDIFIDTLGFVVGMLIYKRLFRSQR